MLQQQLNSPTHSRPSQLVPPTSPTQTQHPILQQALSGAASESQPTDSQTIKSLLAKKLQQNSRMLPTAQPAGGGSSQALPIQAPGPPVTESNSQSATAPILAGQLSSPCKQLVGQAAVAALPVHNAIMERLVHKLGGGNTADKSISGCNDITKDSAAKAVPQSENTESKDQPAQQHEGESCQQSEPQLSLPNKTEPAEEESSNQTALSSATKPMVNGPVSNENGSKLNGPQNVASNGDSTEQNPGTESAVKSDESQTSTKSCHGHADVQHINGNSAAHNDVSQHGTLPPSFKRKGIMTPDEIQQKKNSISHWLTAKDNAPTLNGVVKHLGNGDSGHKLNTDFNKDQDYAKSELSKSNSDSPAETAEKPNAPVLENGYASSCESEVKMEVDDSNIPSKEPSAECQGTSLESSSSSVIANSEKPVVTSQGNSCEAMEEGVKVEDGSQVPIPALPLSLQAEGEPSVAYVPPPAPASKSIGHLTVAELLLTKKAAQPSVNGPVSAADSSLDVQQPPIPTADQLQASLRAAQLQSPPSTKSIIASQLQARLRPTAQPAATVTTSISSNPIMMAALKGPVKSSNGDSATSQDSEAAEQSGQAASSSPVETEQGNQQAEAASPSLKRPLSDQTGDIAAKRKRSTSTDSGSSQSGEMMCEWSGCSQ